MLQNETECTKRFGIARKLMVVKIHFGLIPIPTHVHYRGRGIFQILGCRFPPKDRHSVFRNQESTGQKIVLMSPAGVNYDLSNHESGITLLQPTAQPSMKVSVIIPAHNEEEYLPGGLTAVAAAAEICPGEVETVVVLNRCTDRTEEIAREAGVVTVREDSKNLSLIRNAGVAASTGEIVVTIDADSRLHPHFLRIAVDSTRERLSVGCFCLPRTMVPRHPRKRPNALSLPRQIPAVICGLLDHAKAFDAIDEFNPDFVAMGMLTLQFVSGNTATLKEKMGHRLVAPLQRPAGNSTNTETGISFAIGDFSSGLSPVGTVKSPTNTGMTSVDRELVK